MKKLTIALLALFSLSAFSDCSLEGDQARKHIDYLKKRITSGVRIFAFRKHSPEIEQIEFQLERLEIERNLPVFVRFKGNKEYTFKVDYKTEAKTTPAEKDLWGRQVKPETCSYTTTGKIKASSWHRAFTATSETES